MSDILTVIESLEAKVESAESRLQQVRRERDEMRRLSKAWGRLNAEVEYLADVIKKTNHDIKLLRKEVARQAELRKRSSGK